MTSEKKKKRRRPNEQDTPHRHRHRHSAPLTLMMAAAQSANCLLPQSNSNTMSLFFPITCRFSGEKNEQQKKKTAHVYLACACQHDSHAEVRTITTPKTLNSAYKSTRCACEISPNVQNRNSHTSPTSRHQQHVDSSLHQNFSRRHTLPSRTLNMNRCKHRRYSSPNHEGRKWGEREREKSPKHPVHQAHS